MDDDDDDDNDDDVDDDEDNSERPSLVPSTFVVIYTETLTFTFKDQKDTMYSAHTETVQREDL